MSKRSGNQRADGRGGGYALLPHHVIDAALQILSPRAVAALLAIARRFNGFNNGMIALSMRDLATAINSPTNPSNSKAIEELRLAGFIEVTRFPKGQRKANHYRLTFVSTGRNGEFPATNDFLQEMETKKISVSKPDTRMPLRVSETYTRRKLRVSETYTGATETSGVSTAAPVLNSDTHIVSHGSSSVVETGNIQEITPKTWAAPFSTTAGMELHELRQFCRRYLEWAETGAQSQLAHRVGIPPGTLSKFLSGRSLPSKYRIPLQSAVGAAFPLSVRPAGMPAFGETSSSNGGSCPASHSTDTLKSEEVSRQ